MESMERPADDHIVLPQRMNQRAPRAASMHQTVRARITRRNALPRNVEWNAQDAGTIARALSRLEREHVALLWALCELDSDVSTTASTMLNTPAMVETLRTLIQSDLRRAQHALQRAAEGLYGLCEDCHRPLAARQLALNPAATRCAGCDADLRRTYH